MSDFIRLPDDRWIRRSHILSVDPGYVTGGWVIQIAMTSGPTFYIPAGAEDGRAEGFGSRGAAVAYIHAEVLPCLENNGAARIDFPQTSAAP